MVETLQLQVKYLRATLHIAKTFCLRDQMCRCIGLFALLVVVSHPGLKQAAGPFQLDAATSPVKQVAIESRSSAEIDFAGFEFLQLWITNHPGHSKIKGEPTKGVKYPVRARIYGEDAISTAKFEAIDQAWKCYPEHID